MKEEIFFIVKVFVCVSFVFLIASAASSNIFEFNLRIINWEALSAVVLLITAYFIYRQAKITSDLFGIQAIPSIETFLVSTRGGNAFVFYNLSPISGIVVFDLFFKLGQNGEELKYGNAISYRIPAAGLLITANTFFINNDLPKGIEIKEGRSVIIKVLIKPADLNNVDKSIKRTYAKKYVLRGGKWDEGTIGFPDVMFFRPKKEDPLLEDIQRETAVLMDLARKNN